MGKLQRKCIISIARPSMHPLVWRKCQENISTRILQAMFGVKKTQNPWRTGLKSSLSPKDAKKTYCTPYVCHTDEVGAQLDEEDVPYERIGHLVPSSKTLKELFVSSEDNGKQSTSNVDVTDPEASQQLFPKQEIATAMPKHCCFAPARLDPDVTNCKKVSSTLCGTVRDRSAYEKESAEHDTSTVQHVGKMRKIVALTMSIQALQGRRNVDPTLENEE